MSPILRSATGERIGGSLAHADPASELPACMLALDATIIVRGPNGERRIAAADFFREFTRRRCRRTNCWSPSNCRSSATNSAHFFHEFARRHGDYAIAGLAAQAVMSGDVFADLRLAFFAVGDRPVLAKAAKGWSTCRHARVYRRHRPRLPKNSIPRKISRPRPRCAGIWQRYCCARCVSALLGRPDLDAGGAA